MPFASTCAGAAAVQCSGAQLTALLATATLPSPGGALGPAAPQAGAARSSRHSHLFFSQTAITLRIRKQPTKAFCLLCLNSYKDKTNVSHFLGLAGETRAVTPACQHKRKPCCVRPPGLSSTGHWRRAEPLPRAKKRLRTARLPAWKPSPLPQITALTSPILMKMILLPGEYGSNKTYSKDFSIYFLKYWYLKCAKTLSQHTEERNWVNVNHKITSAQEWHTGCDFQMCQSRSGLRRSRALPCTSAAHSTAPGRAQCCSAPHYTALTPVVFCRWWDLHRPCISSERNCNSVPTGILILKSSKRFF